MKAKCHISHGCGSHILWDPWSRCANCFPLPRDLVLDLKFWEFVWSCSYQKFVSAFLTTALLLSHGDVTGSLGLWKEKIQFQCCTQLCSKLFHHCRKKLGLLLSEKTAFLPLCPKLPLAFYGGMQIGEDWEEGGLAAYIAVQLHRGSLPTPKQEIKGDLLQVSLPHVEHLSVLSYKTGYGFAVLYCHPHTVTKNCLWVNEKCSIFYYFGAIMLLPVLNLSTLNWCQFWIHTNEGTAAIHGQ